jgi:hypothetical protein
MQRKLTLRFLKLPVAFFDPCALREGADSLILAFFPSFFFFVLLDLRTYYTHGNQRF